MQLPFFQPFGCLAFPALIRDRIDQPTTEPQAIAANHRRAPATTPFALAPIS